MCRLAIALTWISLIVVANQAQADDEYIPSALEAKNAISWSTTTVRILDPDNQPLRGATVKPWALRAGRGHGAWPEEEIGSPKQTVTDGEGRAEVVYPTSRNWSLHESNPVVAVSIVVSHAEFCSRNVHVDIPKDEQQEPHAIPLERGFKLKFSGVEPGSDRPLSHCHLLLENGDSVGPDFVQQPDNWLVSNPVKANRRWFRIVRVPPDGPPQFSKPQAWSADDPASQTGLVVVNRGVRVSGKISDDVPRPITRGYVCCRCGSPVPRDEDGNQQQGVRPIFWLDWAPIAKDGTFEFPSLPAGFLGQFYAFANDSISAQPSEEAYETCCNWFGVQNRQRHDVFRYGQVLRLVGTKSELTIEMESAGQARLKCTTAEGKPLAGIMVSSWPNQFTVGGGSWGFCTKLSTLERLRSGTQSFGKPESPYSERTNEAGEAVIRNLPPGKQSFYAANEIWASEDQPSAEITAESVTAMTIALKRKP